MKRLAVMMVAVLPGLWGGAAAAQASGGAAPSGSVAGTVLAAANGQPLAGAVVVLESAGDAAIVMPASTAFLVRNRTAVTDSSGSYRFSGIAAGAYRLIVRHLGYRQAVLDVTLGRDTPFRVSVGLVVNPILLEPLDVRAAVAAPYGRDRTVAEEVRVGSLNAKAWRDERLLAGDATVLTHSDVIEGVTLGETDLFRALQRLPGVSTRDDFTAALWTRGAPWSQTRVYLDGLPLFNPVHAIGVFSGVNPDAVGAATFHPGARTAAVGEGAAGVLAVTSRGAAGPGLRGLAELSVVSARVAADWGSRGGRTGVMVAARRSWVDLATRIAEWVGGDTAGYIPYRFSDVSVRVDADLGRGMGLEASAMLEDDAVRGTVPDLLRRTRGHWGNRMGRATLVTPAGPLVLRHTVGVSRFAGQIDPFAALSATDEPVHGPTRNSVTVLVAGTEISPGYVPGSPGSWAAGAELQLQRQHFTGQYPRPYPVVVLNDTLRIREQLPLAALWGERRLQFGARLIVEAGLRVDLHAPVRNAPAVGVAPRAVLRLRPRGGPVVLSAGAARSWQYTQALAPAGPSVGPDLYLTDVWLLAGDTIPALRSDVVSAGAEYLFGSGWVAAAHVFARHETGVAVPEPSPGQLSNQRPVQISARGRAQGLEVSARRLAGRWTGSVSYTYGRSDLLARHYRYPSPADRRHVVDATLMVRVRDALRLGAAFTAASGAPYSRFILGCDSTALALCADSSARMIEAPHAERGPSYASLDFLADWTRSAGTRRFGAFLQVRNVLNRVNAVTYTGSSESCSLPASPTVRRLRVGTCDRFHRGVGLLPLAGLRMTF